MVGLNEYPTFPKIPRVENLYCVMTEKIDGTNALIEMTRTPRCPSGYFIQFGSRTQYIEATNDNHGFVQAMNDKYAHLSLAGDRLFYDAAPLVDDGPDQTIRIYGEWFGGNIQRKYGLKEKHFMPFNPLYAEALIAAELPNVVSPYVIYRGKFSRRELDHSMECLWNNGSFVAPGFDKPEGIVIYFPNEKFYMKETFDGKSKA